MNGLQPGVVSDVLVNNLKYYHTPRHITDKRASFVGYDLYLIGAAEDLSYCLDYGWGVTALEIHEGVSIKSGCLATGALDAGP